MTSVKVGNVSIMTAGIMNKTPEEHADAMMERVKAITEATGIEMDLTTIREEFINSVRAIQLAERERIRQQMRQDF